jgi:hypothetical protein
LGLLLVACTHGAQAGEDAFPSFIRNAVGRELGKDPEDVTVADLANVKELDLGGHVALGNADLAHLKRLTQLEALDLTITGLTDAGLAHLAGLTALKYLELDGTQVTKAGVGKLKKALPECTIIH